MDRKAWLVIIICALGIGVNQWYATKLETQRRAWELAHPKAKADPAKTATSNTTTPAATPTAGPNAPGATPVAPSTPEDTRELKIGSVKYVFSTHGGGVKVAELGAQDKITLNAQGRDPVGAFRKDPRLPDHTVYKITEATDKTVVLEGNTSDNIGVRKVFAVTEGEGSDEHLLKLTVTVTNNSSAPISTDQYYLYAGAATALRPDDVLKPSLFWNDSGDAGQIFTTGFSSWFGPEKKEVSEAKAQLRFGGVSSRFYANIVSHITKSSEETPGRIWGERFLVDHSQDEFKDQKIGQNDYAIHGAVSLPTGTLSAGSTQTYDYQVYLGPREYHRLQGIGYQRQQVMFYGWWTGWVSVIFVNLLRWIHSAVGSWGWAIILMTITVRLITWPIFASSMKQAKRMSKLSPLMKEIQEKYKDNPQKQSEETMRLYKDYGFNPLGCMLPMVVQILVFTGFYGVLQVAAELRGQPFFWVKDLSLPDTVGHLPMLGWAINLLPLLMGISSVIQMKLTPQSPGVDKSQQRMMTFMPFIFVFICYSFASALALYYTTQNIFGIFQSWAMRKFSKDDEPLKKVDRTPPPSQSLLQQPGGQKPKKDKKQQPKLGG